MKNSSSVPQKVAVYYRRACGFGFGRCEFPRGYLSGVGEGGGEWKGGDGAFPGSHPDKCHQNKLPYSIRSQGGNMHRL